MAANPMRFEHDLLISYAHIDDQTLVAGEHGWVSRLHRLLEIRVAQLMGQTPKIWRDPKLQGNDFFADTIIDRLPRIAALLSVFSPRYVQSEWCNRELKEFCRAAQQSGGVRVADKARIFKVVKTPVQRERLPEEVQPMLGYEFFVYDESGRPREMAQEYGPGADRAFLTKLDDLAYDITQLLQLMQNEDAGAVTVQAAPEVSKGTVYLAETSFELKDEREAIKRDLVRNGYEVLPDRPLPLVADELDGVVREQLARCKLSVHLIGKNYGIVPDGSVQSMVERQQVLASQLSAAAGFKSVIWLMPGVEVEDTRQRAFIDHIHNDADVHATAEVLQVPLEELKTLVHQKLTPPPPKKIAAPAPAASANAAPQRVYLLCDQQDVEAVRDVEDHLFARGFEVILPLFDEDEAAARIEHEENLQSCDAVLVYYGAAGELWLRRKLRELQKSAGLGREKPWLGRAIYVGGPVTPQKERFRTLEATLLHEPAGGFDPAVLDAFLQELGEAKALP